MELNVEKNISLRKNGQATELNLEAETGLKIRKKLPDAQALVFRVCQK